MTKKVLFLDIDGVVLPGRAHRLHNQTTGIVKVFDPCAVSMLVQACKKQDRRIVVHSSWIRTGFWKIGEDGPADVIDHCVSQGIPRELFHEDWCCNRDIDWRYNRIQEWLGRHKEVDDYFILDDTPPGRDEHLELTNGHLILTDFDEGITVKVFNRICDGVGK